jgi:hypothetical protein
MKKDQYPDYVLLNGTYWGLDEYSCVLVKRNRAWFDAAIPKIEKIWRTIEKERITGCEHRAPKKREAKNAGSIVASMNGECAIKIDDYYLENNTSQNVFVVKKMDSTTLAE